MAEESHYRTFRNHDTYGFGNSAHVGGRDVAVGGTDVGCGGGLVGGGLVGGGGGGLTMQYTPSTVTCLPTPFRFTKPRLPLTPLEPVGLFIPLGSRSGSQTTAVAASRRRGRRFAWLAPALAAAFAR